jgi:hypothetical protein
MKTKNTCSCCGRDLSARESVETGIGPVCRVSHKNLVARERSGNLFANRSEFDYGVKRKTLWIRDLGGMKSVTNDIENVLTDIVADLGIEVVSSKRIIYQDSMGIWDGINPSFTQASLRSKIRCTGVTFYPLGARSFDIAIIATENPNVKISA